MGRGRRSPSLILIKLKPNRCTIKNIKKILLKSSGKYKLFKGKLISCFLDSPIGIFHLTLDIKKLVTQNIITHTQIIDIVILLKV